MKPLETLLFSVDFRGSGSLLIRSNLLYIKRKTWRRSLCRDLGKSLKGCVRYIFASLFCKYKGEHF